MLKTLTAIATLATLAITTIAPGHASGTEDLPGQGHGSNGIHVNGITTNALNANGGSMNGHEAGGSTLSIQAIELPPETR